MKKMMKKTVYGIFFVLPFLVGTFGLYKAGMRPTDAAFSTFTMYFLNYGDSAPNYLVEVARWGAPVMLASGVILAVSVFFTKIRNFFLLRYADVTALYCKEDRQDFFLEKFENTVYVGDKPNKRAKSHLILMEDDAKTIALANQVENGTVYAELKQVDSYLMNPGKVRYFNTYEIIARQFWKENHLADKKLQDYKIAIVGNNALAEKILRYGLMNNLYALDQRITYYVYGMKTRFSMSQMFNADTVVFCEMNDQSVVACDRIILCGKPDVSLIEKVLYRSRETEIFYYSETPIFEDIYAGTQVHHFGGNVYSNENVMTDKLYQAAMALNYRYECLYGGQKEDDPKKDEIMKNLYDKLSGFLKGSNLAACDYHVIRKIMLEQAGNPEITADDMYVQLEHVRWCRFHVVNGWKYGEPKNKEERNYLRIHPCLKPYEELSTEDQIKDLETIQNLMIIDGQ